EWRREGTRRVEVLGARQAVPVATSEVRPPSGRDLASGVIELMVDPVEEWLLRIPGDDDDSIIHPLAPGSEADYRFRTGETATIVLPEGRRVRLVELQILPRRSVSRLVSGSLWL